MRCRLTPSFGWTARPARACALIRHQASKPRPESGLVLRRLKRPSRQLWCNERCAETFRRGEMSMIGRLRHVPPEELERLQRRPSDMRTFLHGKKIPGGRIEDMLALFQKLEVTKQEVLGRGATSGSPEHLAFMTHVQKELEAAGFGNGVGPPGL